MLAIGYQCLVAPSVNRSDVTSGRAVDQVVVVARAHRHRLPAAISLQVLAHLAYRAISILRPLLQRLQADALERFGHIPALQHGQFWSVNAGRAASRER